MRFLLFLFVLNIFACNAPEPKDSAAETPAIETPEPATETTETPVAETKSPQHSFLTPGMELENVNTEKRELATFPNCYSHQVIVYELDGREGGRAESAFHQRTGKSKVLSAEEITPLLSLINNKESFGNFTAACHDPRIGIVFYDAEYNPCSYLSLCMACNNLYSKPELNLGLEPGSNSGFSKKTRDALRVIFADWGFPDENFSPMFDE